MDRNLHNIDDLFKKAIDEYGETPSSAIWENIDRNLDKKKVVSISEKYKRLKWVAAALLMFSVGMAMYMAHTRMKSREVAHQNSLSNRNFRQRNLPVNKAEVATKKSEAKKPLTNGTLADTGVTDNKNVAASTGENAGNKSALERPVAASIVKKSPRNVNGTLDKLVANNKKNKTATGGRTAFNSAIGSVEKSINKNTQIVKVDVASAGKVNAEFNDDDVLVVAKPVAELAIVHEPKERLKSALPELSLTNQVQRISINNTTIAGNAGGKMTRQNLKALKKSLFSATVFYSPDFVSSKVDNDKRRFREDDRNEIKNKEKIQNASSAGVLLNYNAGNGFSIETGITFSTITTGSDPKMIYARPDDRGNINYRISCSAGYSFVTLKPGIAPVAGDSLTALSSTNTLKYISVPVAVKYHLSKGKFGLHPGIGVAANFLTKGKIETVIAGAAGNEKASSNHIEGLNKSYLNGLISLGASYNFSRRFAFNLTPVARFALSAINKDAPVKTYLNSFGLVAGFTIGL